MTVLAEKPGFKRPSWIALVAALFVTAHLAPAIAPAEEALTVPGADQSERADNIARKAAEDER